MIITIILTLCVFVSWLLIPHKVTRYVLGYISTVALLLMIIGITANMTHHWGMEKKVVTSDKKEIYSAGSKDSPVNMLIANEMGKNSNNYIMVYKNHSDDQKAETHFKPNMDKDHLSESVKHQATYEVKDTDKATTQTKKTVWVWKSDVYKSLFSFGHDNEELIKKTTVVTVPKDTWVVLDAQQAKQLQQSQQKESSKGNQAKQQQQKKAMQQLASHYKKQHPEASQQEINDYLNHQQQVQATKQIKKEIAN